MDLSVVIVNWNTKKLTTDCLSSIFKFTKDVTFEVIVIDNGSNDSSQKLIKARFPQVKLIQNKDNLGFTKANNQGIRISQGKYIMLLNSDAYLIENSFKKLVDFADKIKDLGALGPKLLNIDKTIQQSVGFVPNLPQVFYWMSFLDDLPFGYILKPFHIDHDSFYQKEHEVDWVTGAAILIPKNIIKKTGMLDENIFMYGEEVEWCYRIKKEGYKVVFTPESQIIHIGRGSSGKISSRAFIGEFKGLIYFYKKHKGILPLQLLRIFLKIGALARIFIFTLTGRVELAKVYVEVFKVA